MRWYLLGLLCVAACEDTKGGNADTAPDETSAN